MGQKTQCCALMHSLKMVSCYEYNKIIHDNKQALGKALLLAYLPTELCNLQTFPARSSCSCGSFLFRKPQSTSMRIQVKLQKLPLSLRISGGDWAGSKAMGAGFAMIFILPALDYLACLSLAFPVILVMGTCQHLSKCCGSLLLSDPRSQT